VTLQTWVLFCATETLLSLTPGPAVLLVVGQAIGRGGRAGLAAACGILSANAMYFALSATGLGAILLASSQLFTAIKWLGAIYLIIVGLQMIVRPQRLVEDARADSPVEQDFSPARHSPAQQPRTSFWRGFVTQAANPKALVFFTALLPQFIQPSAGVPMQILILGVSSIVLEFGVLGLYVAASTRARRWTKAPGLSAALQRSAGALLVVAGARLAITDRTGMP
jgi:homoserine/homoserine lactone efflux protein